MKPQQHQARSKRGILSLPGRILFSDVIYDLDIFASYEINIYKVVF